MRFQFLKLLFASSLLMGIINMAPSPHLVLADENADRRTIDISASIVGSRIMAGIQIGTPPGGSDSSGADCEWSPSIPYDATFGSGGPVFKVIGSIKYQLYDYTCQNRTPPTTYHWIPKLTTQTLATEASAIMYDNIPALLGEFAPPARRGVVNIGTWFWVNPIVWSALKMEVSAPIGETLVRVTVTATPTKLHFNPGDGNLGSGTVTCDGPGSWWFGFFGDYHESECMYTYRHSSAMHPSGAFPAQLGVEWHVEWKSNTGLSGSFGDHTYWSSHQMVVHEMQALVTH